MVSPTSATLLIVLLDVELLLKRGSIAIDALYKTLGVKLKSLVKYPEEVGG